MKKNNVVRLTDKEKELIELLREKDVSFILRDVLLGEIIAEEKNLVKYSDYKGSLIYSEAEKRLPIYYKIRNLIKA